MLTKNLNDKNSRYTLSCLAQGILTGMSSAGFSLSINERNLGGSIVEDALEAVLLHSWCPTHLARQVSWTTEVRMPGGFTE